MKWLQTLECVFWLNWLMLQNLFYKYHLQIKVNKVFGIYNYFRSFSRAFLSVFEWLIRIITVQKVHDLKCLRFESILLVKYIYFSINSNCRKNLLKFLTKIFFRKHSQCEEHKRNVNTLDYVLMSLHNSSNLLFFQKTSWLQPSLYFTHSDLQNHLSFEFDKGKKSWLMNFMFNIL